MLMGHSGYLTDAYRRFTRKQMAEYYQKGEYLLSIHAVKEISRMEGELKRELNEQQKTIVHLVAQIEQYERQLDSIQGFMKAVARNPGVIDRATTREARATRFMILSHAVAGKLNYSPTLSP
jgi:hypothetical protein